MAFYKLMDFIFGEINPSEDVEATETRQQFFKENKVKFLGVRDRPQVETVDGQRKAFDFEEHLTQSYNLLLQADKLTQLQFTPEGIWQILRSMNYSRLFSSSKHEILSGYEDNQQKEDSEAGDFYDSEDSDDEENAQGAADPSDEKKKKPDKKTPKEKMKE